VLWRVRIAVVLVVACAAAVSVAGLSGSDAGAFRTAAKKPCHFVTKKVRGKKKRVRVCGAEPKAPPSRPAPSADLIVAGFAPVHAVVGDQVTFQVNVLNRGPSVASGLSVAIETPITLTAVQPALSSGQAAACDTPASGPTAFRCRLDQLPVGGVWMLQFTGTVSTPGLVRFAAAARGTTLDPTPRNAAVDVETQVDPAPDPPPPPPG
jgi:hypothetical protein